MLTTFSGTAFSQICHGSFGDPVVNIDFGRGTELTGFALPAGVTNYSYTAGTPHDGSYTIVKKVIDGGWYNVNNHTPNDPDGYMMMINASREPGVFYETEVAKELCPNTTYEFAAWVINLLTYDGNNPNLTFSILTLNNLELATYNTGDIQESPVATWKQYGFLFNTPIGINRVKIRIRNNGPGGDGNDLALDDITFRACGSKIDVGIDGTNETEKTFCEKTNVTFSFFAAVEGSGTLTYGWQKNDGAGWQDLSNENSTRLIVNTKSLLPGTHQYRFVAAESQVFASAACRTASPLLSLNVISLPKLTRNGSQIVCLGNPITLNPGGVDGIYSWIGPNGFTSSEKSPVITNADFKNSGIYKATIATGNCSASDQIDINVVAKTVAIVEEPEVFICEGASSPLKASGGISYKWTPAEGLSSTDIPDPVASPLQTTLYNVAVFNGDCTDTAHVVVTVFKKIAANAGSDKVIIEGQSVMLDGKIVGDKFRSLWTPSDYLDDPAKLNPIATPPYDMTYILNVWSKENCPGVTSSMTIKVFKKLIIPNTFTPNGDGNNDVWHIAALEAYPKAEIKVFNRYGEKVFGSSMGKTNWDGKYNGVDVPVGTYYYMINLHDGKKPLSGPLTVLR